MNRFPEGSAIVYCEGAYGSPNGKTAHGLVRRCARYNVLCVVDSHSRGRDAGVALDGKTRGIPIVATVEEAVRSYRQWGAKATHLVVGLAPDGGRLSARSREDIKAAIRLGLDVDCGLHDFLSEDEGMARLAKQKRVTIRDVRKPPPRKKLHFFSGIIEQVYSLKTAVLGTDSACGKRTTAWMLVDALAAEGYRAELVGTGQTAWMQGARYGIVLDSLVNDFVSGEIEHAVWSAWNEARPDAIVIEGQGSLLNPAYPGGFEILAAAKPDVIVLQHAPARKDYDGFPGYPIHPLEKQIEAIELLSGKPVVAVSVSREGLNPAEVDDACENIHRRTGRPAFDVMLDNGAEMARFILPSLKKAK